MGTALGEVPAGAARLTSWRSTSSSSTLAGAVLSSGWTAVSWVYMGGSSGVSETPLPERWKSAMSSSRSSRRTARLSTGCATYTTAAAAVMLPWSAVATT